MDSRSFVVLVDAATLHEAEKLLESCERCNPDGAEIPFDVILDRVTRSDPSSALCPSCLCEILEKTLIEA